MEGRISIEEFGNPVTEKLNSLNENQTPTNVPDANMAQKRNKLVSPNAGGVDNDTKKDTKNDTKNEVTKENFGNSPKLRF